jgi:hypothetical protein
MVDRGAAIDLGFRTAGVTSLAFRPRGLGGYLLFGGRVEDAISAANDITRILVSNILNTRASPVSTTIEFHEFELATATLHVDLPRSVRRVMLVATGENSYPYFITAKALTVPTT